MHNIIYILYTYTHTNTDNYVPDQDQLIILVPSSQLWAWYDNVLSFFMYQMVVPFPCSLHTFFGMTSGKELGTCLAKIQTLYTVTDSSFQKYIIITF